MVTSPYPITTDVTKPQYFYIDNQRYIAISEGDRVKLIRVRAGTGYGEPVYNVGGASDSSVPYYVSPEEQRKVEYLKSPTAQWESERAFAGAVESVRPIAPPGTVFRGQVVETIAPKPGEWGYHATAERPGGIAQRDVPTNVFERLAGFKPPSIMTPGAPRPAAGYFERAESVLATAGEQGSIFTKFNVGVGEAVLGLGKLGYYTGYGIYQLTQSEKARQEFVRKLPNVPRVAVMAVPELITSSYETLTKGGVAAGAPRLAGQIIGTSVVFTKLSKSPTTKMLEAPKIKPFKAPVTRVPLAPKGLEILKLPKRQALSTLPARPVSTITPMKTASEIYPQYKAALERGAAPISQRGSMAIQFGSKGYRPTGIQKPVTALSQEIKKFMKEEKAVAYIPTFERVKAQPQLQRKPQVLTMERPRVLESLQRLTVAPKPKTGLPVISLLPITKAKTKVTSKTNVFVASKTYTRTQTKPLIKTKPLVSVKSNTLLRVSTEPRVKVLPQTKPLTLTDTMTETLTKTSTEPTFRQPPKPKKVKTTSMFKKLTRKSKRKLGKFPELSRVASAKRVLSGYGKGL